jgi:probable rRNA maturation factor
MTRVDVQIASDAPGIPSPDEIRRWVEHAASTEVRVPDAEIAVRVVDEREMQTLNRDYRDQDKPTNVLSFPAGDVDGLPAGAPHLLGDIVVCAAVVAREAAEQGKRPSDHWGHMLVHGVLHLLGHDHMNEAEAEAMESLERTILADLGIADPYE